MELLTLFIPIKLSESQRPVFVENEIECLLQDGVVLYNGEQQIRLYKGVTILTTHRLIWIGELANAGKEALALYHHFVLSAEAYTPGFLKFGALSKVSLQLRGSTDIIRLGFKHGGRDPFLVKYKNILHTKPWEVEEAPLHKQSSQFSTSMAGVGGIMKTLNKKAEETDNSLSRAFTDLNALMLKAKEMVALAERFSAAQEREQKENKGSTSNVEDMEFRSYLLQMGIASPVTKQTAGSLYHTELSRQLSDWLIRGRGGKSGILISTAMIPLPDIYCYFNRARGSELISPEDLYRACVLFEDLNLPVRLRRFDSGVLVVQSSVHNDTTIATHIKQLVEEHGPLTALDVAKYKRLSPALTLEQLQTAERHEFLCRDETFAGVVFYLNLFARNTVVLNKQ